METTPLLLTIRDAAAALGIGKTYMYDLVDAGEIPYVQLGTPKRSMRRISIKDLEAYIETRTEQARQ